MRVFWGYVVCFWDKSIFQNKKRPCDLQGFLKVICRYCKNGGRGNPSPTELNIMPFDKLNKTANLDIGKNE